MLFQRLGMVLPDGTGWGPATCYNLDGVQPQAAPYWERGEPDGTVTRFLFIPMDDHLDDWCRLHAEYHQAMAHLGRSVGDPRRLRHRGGTPHPRLPHVLLPGTFTWSGPPHPDVAAHAALLRAMSTADLIRYHTGQIPR